MVTHPSAIRGGPSPDEAGQAGWAGCREAGRVRSWGSFWFKALLVKVSKGAKGSRRTSAFWGWSGKAGLRDQASLCAGSPRPPWGAGPGQRGAVLRPLAVGAEWEAVTSHHDLEMGQTVALTEGECPEN